MTGAKKPRRLRVTHVQPGFFRALGRPVTVGREFDEADLAAGAAAIIADSTFVRRVLGENNPLGRRLRFTDGQGQPVGPSYQLVGVVDDLGLAGSEGIEAIGRDQAEGGLYLPLADASRSFGLVARSEADAPPLSPRLRGLIADIDPSYIVSEPRPVQTVVSDSDLRATAPITAAVLLTVFLVVLAAAATYALVSLTVSQRRREIGIRTAMGAQSNHITRLVARRAFGQLAIGAAVGVPLAWRLLQGAEVSGLAGSRLAFAVLLALAVVLVVGMVACTGPILKALRVMPSETLHADA